MRVLLVRPASPNERFGLGPFFRIEPLGLEYIASALLAHGHEVRAADLRFGPGLPALIRRFKPRVLGVTCIHTVDTPAALRAARLAKRCDPSLFTMVGGHAAASYPLSLFDPAVDAIAFGDGETVVPAALGALGANLPLQDVPGLWVRSGEGGGFVRTHPEPEPADLDEFPLPERRVLADACRHYHVVHKRPMAAIETSRGCPFHCTFCSIARLSNREHRTRGVDPVCADLASVGENLFIIDDLFWHPHDRSFALGREAVKRVGQKSYTLVQTRLDIVSANPDVLEVWRPFSRDFDIFFGFEAPTDDQLKGLGKGFGISTMEEGVRAARFYQYGVTGNFVIDPDWEKSDFERMWDLVDRLKLNRVGYTILTPLPGTALFERMAERIVESDWSKYDMHHILFEPRLGRRGFFDLFARSWKRNVLSSAHAFRNWSAWLREVKWSQVPLLLRILHQTQRNCNMDAYLKEAFPLSAPAALARPPGCREERAGSREAAP